MSMQLYGPDGTRDQLEREAEAARARLLSTLEALDQKRRDLFNLTEQLRRHRQQLTVATSSIAGLALAVMGASMLRTRRRQRRIPRERARALVRFWNHPERVASKSRLGLLRVFVSVGLLLGAAVGIKTSQWLGARRRRPRRQLRALPRNAG